MAITPEGALKIAAAKRGMQLADYKLKIILEKWCTSGKHWQPRGNFSKDGSRTDGLATKCHDCVRVKQPYLSLKGRISTFKGRKHTAEAKAKMSLKKVGKPSVRRGVKHTVETRAKMSQIAKERTPRGNKHYAYIDGRKARHQDVRRSTQYSEWRLAVFTRDTFTCQDCGDKRGGNLEAHHLKAFADFPDLQLIVHNGLTLCKNCHEVRHLKSTLVAKCRRKKHAPPQS